MIPDFATAVTKFDHVACFHPQTLEAAAWDLGNEVFKSAYGPKKSRVAQMKQAVNEFRRTHNPR